MSNLVGNPEDLFSLVTAQMMVYFILMAFLLVFWFNKLLQTVSCHDASTWTKLLGCFESLRIHITYLQLRKDQTYINSIPKLKAV